MSDFPGQGDTAQLDRPAADAAAEAQVVAKAAQRAAGALDIAPTVLAKILGLSKAGSARLVDGTFEGVVQKVPLPGNTGNR